MQGLAKTATDHVFRLLRRPGFLLLLTLASFSGCRPDKVEEPADYQLAKSFVFSWNHLLLDLERYTPGYRPPVSARMFAYVGMAAYEAALPGMKGYLSMADQCPGYVRPAPPEAPEQSFYLPASLNAAYAEIMRQFFPTAPAHLQEQLRLLEADCQDRCKGKVNPAALRQAIAYGKQVAYAVWRWSVQDSLGHEACLYNYDRNYVPPSCRGCWQPGGEHPMPALLPYWGKIRRFAVASGEIQVRPPVEYDERPGSAFYTEVLEVYTISQPLSRENRWIAEFWSDDVPGLTVSPAGRWLSIANQAFEKAQPPMPEMLEAYLRLGVALSDAFSTCWEAKYQYNLERPQRCIQRMVNAAWKPLHENPSFPTYPSGHSAAGAAAAEVLSAALGKSFELTDRTHENRQEFAGMPRTYHSFAEMAKENAFSRVALGVHFRMDCEEGLRIGRLAGKKAVALRLRSDGALAD